MACSAKKTGVWNDGPNWFAKQQDNSNHTAIEA